MASPATRASASASFSRRALTILVLAAWLGLAAGLVEAGYRLALHGVLGRGIGASGDLVWMAPLANLMWLGLPALLLVLSTAALTRLRLAVVVGVLLFIAGFGLSLLIPGFHHVAAAVLALGLAVRGAALFGRHEGAVVTWTGRTLPHLALLTLVLSLGHSAWNTIEERRAIARLGAPSGRMNVLLLVLDTARGMNFSLHGYDRPTTPGLERWARRGTRFDLAIAPAPWTLPSHASMFTGRLPRDLSTTLKRPLDGTYPVLAEALARQGYVTAGFVANMSFCSRQHGLARGFIHYEDWPRSLGGMVHASLLGRWLFDQKAVRRALGYHDLLWRKPAPQVTGDFLDWERQPRSRPFFAFLNYFDSHRPFLPPPPYDRRFARWPDRQYDPGEIIVDFDQTSPEETAWNLDRYDGSIAYLDAAVDTLLSELERRGVLDSTLVIVTSDHGEHFGEHHRVSHGNSLYLHLTQVPLLMINPRTVPAGRVVARPVSLVCLPATVLDLAALPAETSFSCPSFAAAWEPGAAESEPVLAEMPGPLASEAYSLVSGGYHFIKWFDHPAELYDIERDSMETTNLASDSTVATTFRRLAALADQVRRPDSPSDSLRTVPGRERGVIDRDNTTPQ